MRHGYLLLAATLLIAPASAFAQSQSPSDFGPDGPKSDVVLDAEFKQANELFRAMKYVDACPLAEDLVKQRPRNGVFHEALAECYSGKASNAATPEEKVKWMERERAEFRLARALGDNSGMVRIMLENLGDKPFDPKDYGPQKGESKAHTLFRQAEESFARKEMEQAFDLYRQAYEADPTMYAAALYAGDASFNANKLDRAEEWFAKAIAINPNVETAYRYWGDALMKDGKQKEAREKFIDAIIANPYTNASWVGLERFGQRTGTKICSPQIKMPAGPTEGKPGKDGKANINITLAAGQKDDPNMPVWAAYQIARAGWMADDLRLKKAPALKVYRHSVAEETDAIRLALKVAEEQKIPDDKLDPSLRQLKDLDRDGFLEAWILLNHADQGILQDYASYREAHRPQLRGYIEKYIIHPN